MSGQRWSSNSLLSPQTNDSDGSLPRSYDLAKMPARGNALTMLGNLLMFGWRDEMRLDDPIPFSVFGSMDEGWNCPP
jgi:hypothetical protein